MKGLAILSMLLAVTVARPGLLRVPKVYNAVITSNQNLSPSRAYPVIQPVIHQTAIGYVPPVYYTEVAASSFVNGPDVTRLRPEATDASNEYVKTVPSRQSTVYHPAYQNSKKEGPVKQGVDEPRNVESNGENEAANEEDHYQQRAPVEGRRVEKTGEGEAISKRKKQRNEEPVPALSFYPNYQSLYYDPYFYTYNGLNPRLLPGTYYVNYQPYEPAITLPSGGPTSTGQVDPQWRQDGQSSSLVEHRRPGDAKGKAEKIPDVPPPPLPTALPKNF